MFLQKRKFKNSKGLTLFAIYQGEDIDAPVVVMCHGYGSSKDGSTKVLAEKLIKQGISAYRFDFTGCGESQGALETDLTPQQGLDDLESAVNALGKERFALYGSSFGGYVSLIYASSHPVLAIGLKSPVSDFVEVIKNHWDVKRAIGFQKQAENIDIYKKAKSITASVLIVHGGADELVPIAQSEKLLKFLAGEKRLAILHDASHDIVSGPDLEAAMTLLSEFFTNKLL